MKNRLCAFILAVLLLCAAGCGDNGGSSEEPVLLTVGDRSIGYDEARYFLYASAHIVETYYSYVGWDDMLEGIPKSEYIKNEALGMMKLYYTINIKADELDCGLTDEQRAELERVWDDAIEYYGGEEALLEQIKTEGLTEELYRYFNETSSLYANIREALYGDGGTALPTTEQLYEYIEETGYICVTHILLRTINDLGEELPAEEQEQRRELAAELLTRAEDGEDFLSLVTEYGEDPGVAGEPHYYNMLPGQMVTEFETAAYALEENEISDIVKTAYGFHIIKRLPIDPLSFMEEYCNQKLQEQLDEWSQAIPHTTSEEFDNLDVKALYESFRNEPEDESAEASQ